jgi:tetratricopeptide (TPR) repeat protein
MKKSIFALALMLATVGAFAQNKAVNKAKAHLQKQEYSEALEQINLAAEHEKTRDKAQTWYTRGQIYAAIVTAEDDATRQLDSDALTKATESFEKAKSLEKNESSTYYVFADQELNNLWGQMINQGATNYEAGNYEEAYKAFDRALQVKDKDTTAALYAGVAAWQMGDHDKASTYYYKLVEWGNADKDIYNTLIAYERDEKENYENAAKVIQKAKEQFPNDTDFMKQEVSLLIKMDKTAEAKAQLEKAIESESDNADLYFNLGYLNEELGEQDAAIDAYKKALEVDSEHQNSSYNLAVIHYNRAADLIKEANQLGISKADQAKSKKLYAQAAERFKEAIPYMENAVRLHPDNRTLAEITMVAYDRAGMKDKAAEMQKKVDSMPVE